MIVSINGSRVELVEGATVADAVRRTGRAEDARGTAVALNGEVVSRSGWHRELADGDRVEVLTAVQGG